ncbi:MAG TPA: hypothetical protein VIM04_00960 [Candidatus Binatia bacterium]|jgi:hypothetical protein
MDNSGKLFEGDVLAPDQYLEIFTRTNNLEPEQELMLAILADAIECILKYCDEPIPMRAKLFKEAQEWLFDHQHEKDPFSFLNVCEILNFDPSYLRRGISAKIQARSAQLNQQSKGKTDRLKRVSGRVKLRSHSGHRSRAGL